MRHDDLNFEDPRIFPISSTNAILTYVSASRGSPNTIPCLIARCIDRSFALGPPVVLKESETKIQKNWILLDGTNIRDTHWSCRLYPMHVVMRVDMITGQCKHGWTTQAPSRTPSFAELPGGVRGGTNMTAGDGTLMAFGHVKKRFRRCSAIRYRCDDAPPYTITYFGEEQNFTGHMTEYPTHLTSSSLLIGLNDEVLAEVFLDLDM